LGFGQRATSRGFAGVLSSVLPSCLTGATPSPLLYLYGVIVFVILVFAVSLSDLDKLDSHLNNGPENALPGSTSTVGVSSPGPFSADPLAERAKHDALDSVMPYSRALVRAYPRVTIVTFASESFFDNLINLIGRCNSHFEAYIRVRCLTSKCRAIPGSLHVWASGVAIAVYDLQLSNKQVRVLSSLAEVTVIPFDFTLYPPHVANLFNYAFKPLLFLDAVKRFRTVLLLDSGIEVRGSLNYVLENIMTAGYFFVEGSSVYDRMERSTHPLTLQYLGINLTRDGMIERQMCYAGMHGYFLHDDIPVSLLGPWHANGSFVIQEPNHEGITESKSTPPRDPTDGTLADASSTSSASTSAAGHSLPQRGRGAPRDPTLQSLRRQHSLPLGRSGDRSGAAGAVTDGTARGAADRTVTGRPGGRAARSPLTSLGYGRLSRDGSKIKRGAHAAGKIAAPRVERDDADDILESADQGSAASRTAEAEDSEGSVSSSSPSPSPSSSSSSSVGALQDSGAVLRVLNELQVDRSDTRLAKSIAVLEVLLRTVECALVAHCIEPPTSGHDNHR